VTISPLSTQEDGMRMVDGCDTWSLTACTAIGSDIPEAVVVLVEGGRLATVVVDAFA
jgi:hypothetical protein